MSLAYEQSHNLIEAEDMYAEEGSLCATAIAESWFEDDSQKPSDDPDYWRKWELFKNETPIYSISLRQKFWDFEKELATGNFSIEIYRHFIECRDNELTEGAAHLYDKCRVTIARVGAVLKSISERYELGLTEEEIEARWNQAIVEHNRQHKGMFKQIFVREHKKYLSEFFEGIDTGDREYLVLWQGEDGYKDILIRETEKAYLLDLPIVGSKWIPKKAIYVRGTNYCLHKYIANQWCFWYI